MPRGDGTGPMGIGSMTGRGAGYCAGNVTFGYSNCGGRIGRGLSGGRGYRRMFFATGVPDVSRDTIKNGRVYDEKAVLENQQENLEAQLKLVKERLKNFEVQK